MNRLRGYAIASIVLNGLMSCIMLINSVSCIIRGSLIGGLIENVDSTGDAEGFTVLLQLFAGIGGALLSVAFYVIGAVCGISCIFFVVPLIMSIVYIKGDCKGSMSNVVIRLVLNLMWTIPYLMLLIFAFDVWLLPLGIIATACSIMQILRLYEIKKNVSNRMY